MIELLYYILFFAIVCSYCWFARRRPGWSLALVPLMVILSVVLSIWMQNPFYLIMGIVLLIAVIIIVNCSKVEGEKKRPWYKFTASVLCTTVEHLFYFAVFAGVFNLLGPAFFIIFEISLGHYRRCRRYNLLNNILSTVSLSMRRSLPLPTAIEAASHGQKKKTAKVFRELAYWLTQGWSFSDALAKSFPKCPSHFLASIRTAEQINQLPAAIESIEADITEKMRDPEKAVSSFFGYPLFLLVNVLIISMGLAVFILPVFAEVLADMTDGTKLLPYSTQALLNMSTWLLGNKGLNLLIVVLITQFVLVLFIWITCHKRKPHRPGLISKLFDLFKWHLPLVHWFEKNAANLQLCQSMRIAMQSGCPLDKGLQNAAGLDINWLYRKQIKNWLGRIKQGESTASAAKAAGLDKTLIWAFDEKINQGNTPGVLKNLEDSYRSLLTHRRRMVTEISWPFLIIAAGSGVGWVVYAMFVGIFSMLIGTLEYSVPF